MTDTIQEPTSRWSKLLGRWFPALSMRADWDLRAREDAHRYIAGGHARTDTTFWESGRWDLEHRVLQGIELSARARVLEIGCGMGRLLRPISERVEWAYGVDISVEMIERSREAVGDRANVTVFPTRGRLVGIHDASLDFVYSFIVFQHVPSKSAVELYIREAARTLKGGGVFRFQVDGRPRPDRSRLDTWLGVWFEDGEITRVLNEAGFEVVSVWGQQTHYFLVTARRQSVSGRPETAAVRARGREWNSQALSDLFARVGAEPADCRDVVAGRKCLRQIASRLLERSSEIRPEDLVRRSYGALLGREADPEGLAFYASEIASGVPPSNMIDCLVSSPEIEDLLRPTAD